MTQSSSKICFDCIYKIYFLLGDAMISFNEWLDKRVLNEVEAPAKPKVQPGTKTPPKTLPFDQPARKPKDKPKAKKKG